MLLVRICQASKVLQAPPQPLFPVHNGLFPCIRAPDDTPACCFTAQDRPLKYTGLSFRSLR